MKKRLPSIILGFIIISTFFCGALADDFVKTIQASIDPEIKMLWNNSVFVPKDTDGSSINPIIYNGRSYLPVRAIAEKAGIKVSYDSDTKTISLNQDAAAATQTNTGNSPTPTPNKAVAAQNSPTPTPEALVGDWRDAWYSIDKVQYKEKYADGKPTGEFYPKLKENLLEEKNTSEVVNIIWSDTYSKAKSAKLILLTSEQFTVSRDNKISFKKIKGKEVENMFAYLVNPFDDSQLSIDENEKFECKDKAFLERLIKSKNYICVLYLDKDGKIVGSQFSTI